MRLQKINLLEVDALIQLSNLRKKSWSSRTETEGIESVQVALRPDPIARAARDLKREQLDEVIALMWLGRGASGETVADWPQLIANASGCDSTYLSDKAPLGEYLDQGLRKLGYKDEWRFQLVEQ